MGNPSADYREYLASPHWQAIRVRYRESDLPQRCMCGESQVDLHHKTYQRLGREELTDLLPLCRRCHVMVHVLERRGEVGLDLVGFHSLERALAYAPGVEVRRRQALDDWATRLDGWQARRRKFERWLVAHLAQLAAKHGLTVQEMGQRCASDVAAIRRRLDSIEAACITGASVEGLIADWDRFALNIMDPGRERQRSPRWDKTFHVVASRVTHAEERVRKAA
jgi:hypothetical protein